MKKIVKYSAVFFVLTSLFLVSCDKNNKENVSVSASVISEEDIASSPDSALYYGDTEGAFALDYTAEIPEDRPISLKLNASAPVAEAGSSQAKTRKTKELNELKTKYNTQRKNYSDFNFNDESDKISNADKASAEKTGSLTVIDWGPKGTIVSESEYPTFYVVFSSPVRALTALSDLSDKSDVMEITPKINGTFHWLGTDQLAFEASESADPTTEYKIKISENLTSVSGQKITGEKVFSTKAVSLNINTIFPGASIENSSFNYSSSRGVPPSRVKNFVVRLNYKITAAEFIKIAAVSTFENGNVKYTVTPVFEDKFGASFDKDKGKTTTFAIKIADDVKIPSNSKVVIKVTESKTAPSKDKYSSDSYNTLKPFKIDWIPSQVQKSSSGMSNPIYIEFTQRVSDKKLETFASAITLKKSNGTNIVVGKENLKVVDNELYIYDLPINEYGSEYTLSLKPGVFEDVYGQKLASELENHSIRVPDAKSYFNIPDYGSKMLEWQFPHKIAFDYQNIYSTSKYELSKIDNPLYSYYRDIRFDNPVSFKDTPLNTKRIDTVELDPYLDDGFGFVEFKTSADTYYYYKDWSTDELKKENTNNKRRLLVQVTDLGITARIGINRAVVLVRSLSTNKPVSGAEISVYGNDSDNKTIDLSSCYATGTTDENGFAVIPIDEENMRKIENSNSSVALFVKNGKDKATFVPNTHGYNWNSIRRARKSQARVFLFTDRGLYKPGETVSFRGIDKTQKLGQFISYEGDYTIKLKKSSWNDDTVYRTLTGSTSDSGGFYGSFDLPSDLEPGSYEICYIRKGDTSYYGTKTLYFQVAYFEPLKIQGSVSIPKTTYYAGDSLNANINASYLAGGALSEADYYCTWLRNPTDFRPDTAFASGYRFGPLDRYESSKTISENRGKLSADGSVNDSVVTEKTRLEVPYNYLVDVSLTDISNQRISCSAYTTVHASRFYAGVKMNNFGFPKKGENVDFSFIIATPDGEAASTDLISGDLSLDLTRISWELTNMNGVEDEIYSRYEQVKTSVKNEKIKSSSISNGMGKISFTPEKSGRYVLTLKGKDVFGNPVKTEYGFYVTGSDYYWYGNDSNELNLTADKNLYNPGDKAQILLSSPLEEGDYLITIEREGIFTQEVRHFDSSCSVIEVPIARSFVPVVYVSVASYSTRTKQPTHEYGEKDTDKPKGYYGVTELYVNPFVRAFSLSVESDKMVYRPGEEATITLKATKGGQPVEGAELTLMAVDRAILDLINYHVPNPVDFFYDKYYFGNYVQGGDSRDMLMDPVTYAIKNLQGGDADESKEDERKDFKPTALFKPVIITDKNGIAKVTFKLPDNLTTFRVTAVGVSGELFAIQENEIGVRNPINVQSVQPRRLRVRDTAECGVLVTNLDNVKHSVKISLSIRKPQGNYEVDTENGLITLPGEAFIDGTDTQTIEVPSGASYTAYFDVGALKEGNVELVYTVKSDVLNEKLVSPILIEKTYVYETVTMTGQIDADDKNTTHTEFIQIPSWADDGEGSLNVTLDATRLGLLSSAVKYVFDYPYGCIEQRTSKTIPLVIFEKYIDVFGLDSNVKDVRKVVESHFKFLKKYQRDDGGFGYWPSSDESSLYVSLKVAELYAYALEHGYKSSELKLDLDKLVSFIENNLTLRTSDSYKAYAYYVLSKCERYNDSKIAALYQSVKDKNLLAMTYCGLYYTEQGDSDNKARGKIIADEVRKYLQISERSVSINQPNSDGYWSYFGNETEQMSLILRLFVQIDSKDRMVDKLILTLLQKQKTGYWYNTATTASVLETVYTYIKARNLDAVKFTAQAELMGIKLVDGKFEGAGAKPVSRRREFKSTELAKLERGKNLKLNFSKNGTGSLYYTTEMRYALPDELQNARDEGLRITYQIIDSDSGKIIEPKRDSKIIELESGVTYKAKIIISTAKDRTYMALRAPVPSGAEIIDANFVTSGRDAEISTESSGSWWGHWMSNQVLYDNEAQFFWDDFEKGTCTVEFKFRTARRGVYPVPSAQAELMYEPEVFGRSDGYLFIIK